MSFRVTAMVISPIWIVSIIISSVVLDDLENGLRRLPVARHDREQCIEHLLLTSVVPFPSSRGLLVWRDRVRGRASPFPPRPQDTERSSRGCWRHATMILSAFRHGLRAAELVDLCWDQIEFRTATLHVRRLKQGTPSTHPLLGYELRALRRLQREQDPKSPFVFTSERGAPFSTAGFARMVERAGAGGKLGFKAHPHMLRHACGFALANKGHDTRALQAYLGHRNIQHTVRYSELTSKRFKEFWRD